MEPPIEQSLRACFHLFTIPEVISAAGEVVYVPPEAKRKRELLFEALEAFPEDKQRRMCAVALSRVGTKRRAKDSSARAGPTKRACVQEPERVEPVDVDKTLQEGPFFQAPTSEVTEGAIISMIDRTNNAAMEKKLCMSCARRLFVTDLVQCSIAKIPNARRLIPRTPHPAHELVGNLLLHEAAVSEPTTFLCLPCRRKLLMDECPPFALANNMWIGKVPFQLCILTLPERMLIALFFPAAYVVKLYPKMRGGRTWDEDTVNSGLKGNVSTYKLNTAQIAGIMTGNTLPPSPRILAATIGVTFVGAADRPLKTLPDFLRVRRQRVFEALLWLKAHNRLYSGIDISQEQLLLLPLDAIPDEILLNTRYSTDVAGLEREQAGYVPRDAADEEEDLEDAQHEERREAVPTRMSPEREHTVTEPAVFQLQAHGVVDVHGDSVPDGEVMAHAWSNAAGSDGANAATQRDFLIRKGSAFINEYPRRDENGERFDGGPENPNHMLGAFPVLFPYGMGGLEVNREDDVAYEAHVRWALEYGDGRFRKDFYFIFQAFGVIQKRQVCRSAGLQIKRSAFIANRVSFLKLRPADLVKASGEENRRVAFSNPTVKSLRKQLSSIRARVQGTDESRVSIRSQVWGMNLLFNPPSIWATLNLPDMGDPVAQVLAGKDIDLDNFIATAGPDSAARSLAIAGDPFAAAEFFHLTIGAILEDVFGISAKNHQVKIGRKPGIVGVVNAYIGTVEAQARGSLHLHILFWLQGAPSSDAMRAALETEAFRAKVRAFLKATIRADIKGTTEESVLPIKKQPNIAYSRPVDPREPNYEYRRHQAEAAIARAVQVHTCTVNTCLRTKNGRLVCKRRAPWTLSSEEWVLPSGEWGPRRVFGRMNAWNPPLLQITRANQDMKIVTHSHQTKSITFYISMYIAKKQNQASNASALLAQSMAFQRQLNTEESGTRDINKKMITQCANTLSRDQELSAPEVISYLMGWGDRFISHNYVPIYWDELTGALRRKFPALATKNIIRLTAEQLGLPVPEQGQEEPFDPPVRLRVDDGVFVLKDQLKEYTDRGHALDDMSYFDYHVTTYNGRQLKAKMAVPEPEDDPMEEDPAAGDDAMEEDQVPVGDDPMEEDTPALGRPPSQRVPYLPESNRKGCRIIRSSSMETAPQFIGTWFPRSDNVEYYCANMLALLKPWRDLGELCAPDGTFKTNFDLFMETATVKDKRVIQNINYFHECSDSAKSQRDAPLEVVSGTVDLHDYVRREMELDEINALEVPLCEADVDVARNEKYAAREYMYGQGALNVAYGLGIFDDSEPQPFIGPHCAQASSDDVLNYQAWGAKLAELSKSEAFVVSNQVSLAQEDAAVIFGRPAVYEEGVTMVEDTAVLRARTADQQKTLDLLNVEQRRAHNIIESHLRKTMEGVEQEQLLMIVRGEGGTGKTVLLNAIADTFEYLEVSKWLAKTATTGVAASLVGGTTVHSWASIPINAEDDPRWVEKGGPLTVEKRKRRILPAKYLNIDECSMITKRLLAQLSQIIGQVKSSNAEGNASRPFGGMNVILFGDFHQFPPVGDPSGALYSSVNKRTQSEIGAAIYRQFKTVITLTEQRRITDVPWRELLQRLRTGACTEDDISMLNSLVVTNPSCVIPDNSTAPWDSAVLVTPRHGARVLWNTAALMKHCRSTGNRMYICKAEDTVGNETKLDLRQRVIVAGMPVKKTAKLAERVELAIGMRAMVLMNIATEADLANGTRGEIVDIRLDPREPTVFETDRDTGATILQYPPALVLFKPDDSSYPAFEGLDQGILPIVPSRFGFSIQVNGRRCTVNRRQLAMTSGYAFTDYKSQGQTIQHVYIDLWKPPTGKLTPFSAYVALSRSKGRDRIRLLREFETELFTTHPSKELAKEDERLDALTIETKQMYP